MGTAGLCRFCGSADAIAVAPWPAWATKLITVELGSRYALRVVESVKSQILKALPVQMREDFIAARKIRVACKRCHHGWMGRVDAQARPFLVPLVTGDAVVLTPDSQKALAAWIAKTVMIAEFASSDGVVTPAEERQSLRAHLEPPQSWNIWIAKCSGRSWVARYVRHAAGLAARKGVDTQSVTLGMGRVLVHVMTSTVPGMKFELPGKSDSFHFLWPPTRAISWPPHGTLDYRDIQDFSDAFTRDFGAPEVEHIAVA